MAIYAKVLSVVIEPYPSGDAKMLFLVELAGRKGHRDSNRYTLYQYHEFCDKSEIDLQHLMSEEFTSLEKAKVLFQNESYVPIGLNLGDGNKRAAWLRFVVSETFYSNSPCIGRHWIRLPTPRRHPRRRKKNKITVLKQDVNIARQVLCAHIKREQG